MARLSGSLLGWGTCSGRLMKMGAPSGERTTISGWKSQAESFCVFGSVWALSRAVGFLLCWRWTGWHYRFRWLFWAYTGMVVSFALILLGKALWPIVAAQMAFGLCLALIYYSSLFYSMDVGDTKGEHGGFHEAAIGAGIFGGPAVGAASLYFFPTLPNMNAWAVSALLLAGLAGLGVLRRRGARPPAEPTSGRSQRH